MRPREARDIIMRMYKGDPTDAQKAASDVTYRILDLDLDPEQIRELKERDAAKAPEPAPLGMDGMVCPSCGKKALPRDRFCGECGQRFWEDE